MWCSVEAPGPRSCTSPGRFGLGSGALPDVTLIFGLQLDFWSVTPTFGPIPESFH